MTRSMSKLQIHFCCVARYLDFEILIPCCSVNFVVHNGAIQFAIACIIYNYVSLKTIHLPWSKNRPLASHYYVCVLVDVIILYTCILLLQTTFSLTVMNRKELYT